MHASQEPPPGVDLARLLADTGPGDATPVVLLWEGCRPHGRCRVTPIGPSEQVTLRRLLDNLRPGEMTLLVCPDGLEVPVGDIVLHDPLGDPQVSPGDLVLGVGLETDGRMLEVLSRWAKHRPAAVVVRTSEAASPSLARLLEPSPCAVIGIPPTSSWLQLALLFRGLLAELAVPIDTYSAMDDLFAAAQGIADVVGAPIIIEDPQKRIIAFSKHPDDIDQTRLRSIVTQRVPEETVRQHQSVGIYTRLYASGQPVYYPAGELTELPRLAAPIKAGGELLGSVWAIIRERPPDDVVAAFGRAAQQTAVHLLRHRLNADWSRRTRAELADSILEGKSDARLAAERLGLNAHGYRVLACSSHESELRALTPAGTRLSDLVSMQTMVLVPKAVTTMRKGIVYVVLPTWRSDESEQAFVYDMAAGLARSLGRTYPGVAIGIGGHARQLGEISRSRDEAITVVHAQHAFSRLPRVLEIDAVRSQALLLRGLSAVVNEADLDASPVAILERYDESHSASLLPTLAAYLNEFGDITAAATSLGVHVNTFRYRLKKVQQVGRLDLSDPDQRLASMFELKLRWLRALEPEENGRTPLERSIPPRD